MEKKVKVVIIDSGIDNIEQYNGINIRQKGKKFYINNDFRDELGHGTQMLNLISKHNRNIEFFIVKICSQDNIDINEDILIYALNYVYENIDCDIINLSLSIPCINDYDSYNRLSKICKKLYLKNIIIVCAFDNLGSLSYPACLETVVGVTADIACNKITDYVVIDDKYINIGGRGINETVKSINGKNTIVSGNSVACAHISGIISNLLSENIEINNIKQFLINKSSFDIKKFKKGENNSNFQKEKFINTRAVVFPFNKEIHSVITFEELLICNIIDVYNLKYSGNVGKNTSEILPVFSQKNFIIKDISSINYNSFDTLILGHINELISIENVKKQIEVLIKESIRQNKLIYSFDNVKEIFNIESDNIFFPNEDKESLVDEVGYGKLYRIPIPIIGVFGTSSHQGKFTLQLLLKKEFISRGYNVGQIGTEPSAFLFNMDNCLHFGYNSNNHIVRYDMIAYINFIMNDIFKKNKDLIILGCQSRTIPIDNGNLNDYTLNQIEFLLSSQPDVVILTVNSWDEKEYIIRTISFIEALIECKVIGIFIYPYKNIYNEKFEIYEKKYLELSEYKEICKTFEDELGINVYSFDQIGISCVCNDIINILS